MIGSGPIVIGQACEFDYSGTQACRVLASEGYRIAWCDEMVSWMQHHAAQWGSWNGSVMHGPMMG